MNNSKRLQLMLIFLLIFHSYAYGRDGCGTNRNDPFEVKNANKQFGNYGSIRIPNVSVMRPLPTNLWKGLMREAVSEGYKGMYAVACCVRNRLEKGMDVGLVGLKKSNLDLFVASEKPIYRQYAQEIVKIVFQQQGRDITNGALYYDDFEAFGIPKWAKGHKIKVLAKIGCHTYFKVIE